MHVGEEDNIWEEVTSGSRDPGTPDHPDFETLMYNLRAKNEFFGSLFYICFTKFPTLSLLSMNIVFLSHFASLTLLNN